jgi:Protein of unknown function (DUF3152)
MPCRYGDAVWRLVPVTLLALLAVSPAVAHAAKDRDGRFTFTGAAQPLVEPPSRSPGLAGELRAVRVPDPEEHGLGVAILVEGRLPLSVRSFARAVEEALRDPRGWRRAGYSFHFVDPLQADIEIVLASPSLTDRLCAPLQTLGIYSCAQGSRAVLNFARWQHGASAYRSLSRYRTYMINHEVGHLLGRGHVYCPAPGALAPLMVQQTKGVAPCRPNPWPLAGE